ncbi:hypothetical protein CDD80_3187 [Ophiocordyceps camponoti-rufipedis]|uniref:Uncharacterized protein n=1 Tax=Ophiocordyceps camponoti-rufipedis TaxID=2004952 RepID=A0A2C5YZU0_9HYPO|nr:hypothetical protein CDD80_3187 [Ophiocordyceps camponoti-rufipedis]
MRSFWPSLCLAAPFVSAHWCGQFQQSSLLFLLDAVDVQDPLTFVAQHDSPLHYEALFSVLPKELLKEIHFAWNLNPHSLSKSLCSSAYPTPTVFIQRTMQWYRNAAHAQRQICWPKLEMVEHPSVQHKDVLGAINNLIFDPLLVENDMGLRHLDLPPGDLRSDVPICFGPENNATKWLEHRIPLWRAYRSDPPLYVDLSDIRRVVNTWGGVLPRLLLGMLKDTDQYHCDQRARCVRNYVPGEPILPRSYSVFLDFIWKAIEKKHVFCISLGKVSRNRQANPNHYWFVSGEGQLTEKERHLYGSLAEWKEDVVAAAMEPQIAFGGPQSYHGRFDEGNDYSNRRWDEPFRFLQDNVPGRSRWVLVGGSSQGGSNTAAEAQDKLRAGHELEV